MRLSTPGEKYTYIHMYMYTYLYQFTCFTSTKGRVLTPEGLRGRSDGGEYNQDWEYWQQRGRARMAQQVC